VPHVISLDSDPLADAEADVIARSGMIDWESMYHREVAKHVKTKLHLADARARITVLETELADLKAVVAKLVGAAGRNSSNSSRPPSSDQYRPKRAMPKTTTNKPGGQPKHTGVTRPFATPDVVVDHYEDGVHTEAVSVDALEVGETRGEWVLAERRQVVDVTVQTQVTEHRLWRRATPKPGIPRILSSELLPPEASAPVAFHPHVRAMALFMGQSVTVPDRWVAKTISELCGLELAPATYQSWRKAASAQLTGVIDAIRAGLLCAPVLCMDETQLRVDKVATQQLHVACNDELSLFHIGDRTTEGCDAGGVLMNFTGTIVSDCYLSYWTNKAVKHQRCNAHLLRDLQAVVDDFAGQSGDPGAWAHELQLLILATKAKRAAAKDGVLTPRQYALARNAMVRLAKRGLGAHSAPASKEVRSYQIDTDARALANRVTEHIDEYLTYTRDPQVPFTNNDAEGAIRHAKVKQRRSGIHRSIEAAKEYARIRSYLETGRKHGEDSARLLEALAGGHPWFPPEPTAPTR